MLTVGDVQAIRLDRARTNHESYKLVLQRVYDRIRNRTSLNHTDLSYSIPPFIPGRPVYDLSHAARYVTEKLQRGGFAVTGGTNGVLLIDWSLPPSKDTARRVVCPAAAAVANSNKFALSKTPRAKTISQRLEALKSRLKL